jgi:cytochrome P450
MRGRLDWTLLEFHERYGEVVRFSPDELSFTNEQAWKDIYGFRQPLLVKDPVWYNAVKAKDQAASIFNASHDDHNRIRKQLSHAFSDKALREQETLVKGYIDLLITKLCLLADQNMSVDLVKWYNFTTFDMIGDLALGKSFRCLENSQYHGWVSNIFKSIKIGPFVRTIATYTDVQRMMRLLAPRAIKLARAQHEEYVRLNGEERLSQGVKEERKDFISYILKGQEKDHDSITDREIIANCNFLLLAGSETTATALSGLTYYLLKSPNELRKVTDEIRTSFKDETEINFLNTSARLPFTIACINEALRLYPPGPNLFPRRTPKGTITNIAGYEVPEWVSD